MGRVGLGLLSPQQAGTQVHPLPKASWSSKSVRTVYLHFLYENRGCVIYLPPLPESPFPSPWCHVPSWGPLSTLPLEQAGAGARSSGWGVHDFIPPRLLIKRN